MQNLDRWYFFDWIMLIGPSITILFFLLAQSFNQLVILA